MPIILVASQATTVHSFNSYPLIYKFCFILSQWKNISSLITDEIDNSKDPMSLIAKSWSLDQST